MKQIKAFVMSLALGLSIPMIGHADSAKGLELYSKKKFEGSYAEFKKTANDPLSQFMLGYLLETNKITNVPKTEAEGWFQKAKQNNVPEADLFLSFHYQAMGGDYSNKAQSYLKEAANHQIPVAEFAYALWLREEIVRKYGSDYEKTGNLSKNAIEDSAVANKYMESSAQHGYVQAQVYLATFLESGILIEQNEAKAKDWFEKAAKNGSIDAKASLGKLAEKNKNYAEAFKWYSDAVNQSDAFLKEPVTFKGKTLFEEQDVPPELSGDSKAYAANQLGSFYAKGKGTIKNSVKAMYWYEYSVKKSFNLQPILSLALFSYTENRLQDSYMWTTIAKSAISQVKASGSQEVPAAMDTMMTQIVDGLDKKIDQKSKQNAIQAANVWINKNGLGK